MPGEGPAAAPDSGAVSVIHGSADGLTAARDQFWTQDSPGVRGASEAADQFGSPLAAANVGHGPRADLVVGVPFEDSGATVDTGAVQVMYGSAHGLAADLDQRWTQDSPGIRGTAAAGEGFGFALTTANFGYGGRADLAIGVPLDDVAAAPDSGGVNVLYGSAEGLAAADNQLWTQDSRGVPGRAAPGDAFGRAMTSRGR